ncbi:MAG TPA: membrane protein insertion efficiency factor YidD [Thermoanaerobaculia bacterium]
MPAGLPLTEGGVPAASHPRGGSHPRGRRRPSLAGPILAALLGLAIGDALRPVPDQFGARIAVRAIDLYRATVSPALAKSGLVRCRFEPTCSAYGREAIARYGSPRGFAMAAGRILRCNPWTPGGKDPVP